MYSDSKGVMQRRCFPFAEKWEFRPSPPVVPQLTVGSLKGLHYGIHSFSIVRYGGFEVINIPVSKKAV